MRTSKDRLRHTILFEILLVLIIGPLLSVVLKQPMHTMGALTVTLSLIAMVVNYVYNLAFDHTLKWLGRPVYERSRKLRALHSILFELCLLAISLPVVMLLLNYTIQEALMLDVGFIIIVPGYALIFNIIYDRTFPIPSAG